MFIVFRKSLLLILNGSPSTLQLLFHGLNIGPERRQPFRVGGHPGEILRHGLHLAGEVLADGGELLDVGVDLEELSPGGLSAAELSLKLGRLVVELPHAGLGVGPEGVAEVGHALELVLGRLELLLEGHVGGGEPLVVAEEALDLLVLGRETLLDDRRGVQRDRPARAQP